MRKTPVVGIPADYVPDDDGPYNRIYTKYVAAVRGLGAIVIGIPAIGYQDGLLQILDGILLPGSRSNVAPAEYGRAQEMEPPYDCLERDATTLPLIRAAVQQGVPLFGICRGNQEINVALGGTLYQQLNKIGRSGHQWTQGDTLFEDRHDITLTVGGRLHKLLEQDRVRVNSEHNQAIDDLAPSLIVEALADDGTIEAVAAMPGQSYIRGVQWHPEVDTQTNPISRAVFEEFGREIWAHANPGEASIL